jgi:uncharacterized membrane protein
VRGKRGTGTGGVLRYQRDSSEFARVENLSDAIFAIAMTLLVFTLERPDVRGEQLGKALADQAPELIAFVLSFAVIANAWWLHHKFFALLEEVEPALVLINLLLLMAVALLPFPTSLIGSHPTFQAAVLPYLGLVIVISGLYLALLLRARAADLWRVHLPAGLFPWLVGGWAVSIGVLLLAFGVAVWVPVAGLVLLPLSGVAEVLLVARRAPGGYRRWA